MESNDTNEQTNKQGDEVLKSKRGRKPNPNGISKTKEYYRLYYHNRIRVPHRCEFCNKIFCCKSSLITHKFRNKDCIIIRFFRESELNYSEI